METLLLLNGFEIHAGVDDQEELILSVASGEVDRLELKEWLEDHLVEARM